MQLRRGLRVVRRGPDEVQIGTDPRWAVRVRGLAPAQADRLLRAGDGPLDGWLPRPVLDRLGQAGLLRGPGRPRPAPAALLPEVVAHGLARADGDGHGLLRRRAAAVVAVSGLDRVGLTVAHLLAVSGVGTLRLADPGRVRPDDVAAGVHPGDVGRARTAAATAAVGRAAPRTRLRTLAPDDVPPDVAVTVAADAVDPSPALDLVVAGVPHLPVVVGEAGCVLGPFVLPDAAAGPDAAHGAPPCLRCVDLHRAAADPAWPTVLAQLTSRHRRPVPGPPAALAAVAGGLAAAEVLAHLDGDRPRTLGAQYEVAVPGARPELRTWAAHPDCGCAAL